MTHVAISKHSVKMVTVIIYKIRVMTHEKYLFTNKSNSPKNINQAHQMVRLIKFKFNEISSEAGQMASIPGYTIVSRNTFQYTMI